MNQAALTTEQKTRFEKDGYLVMEDAVAPELLHRLRGQFRQWVEESREKGSPWGETINGKPRFDLAAGHCAARPGLRRVNAPVEISEDYYQAMHDSRIANWVSELIGPDIKFHHSKINSKLPGSGTEVKWHQDFPFTPHSNDNLVTALLMIDAVTENNGPLRVLPGSHRGEIATLWHDGVFTGAVEPSIAATCERSAVSCVGTAGSVCLMHTRLLHGSKPNFTDQPRTLFICVYSAEDAYPCSPNPMPSRFEGKMVRGRRSGRVRCKNYIVEMPELPERASFFDQQDGIR